MSGLIDVIEQLLEADMTMEAVDKTDKAIAKNNGMDVAKPSGGAKASAKGTGIGDKMDSAPGGQNGAMGGEDCGDMNKGKIKSDAKDNSGEVGPGKKGVFSAVTNNSGMDDKGPNKKDKTGPATKETKGFSSDASPKAEPDMKPVDQSKVSMKEEDDMEDDMEDKEKMEEGKSKKEAVGDPDDGAPMDKKPAMPKKDKESDVTDDGEGMDPVGDGDADVDNDGDTDASDEVIMKKRDAIDKADGHDDPDVGEVEEKCGGPGKKMAEGDDEEMMDEKKSCSEDDMMDDEEMEEDYDAELSEMLDELSEVNVDDPAYQAKLKAIRDKHAANRDKNQKLRQSMRTTANRKFGEKKEMEEAAQKTDGIKKEKMPGKESGVANDKHRPPEEKGDNMPKDKMNFDKAVKGDNTHDQGGDEMESSIKADKAPTTKSELGKGNAPAEADKGPNDQSKMPSDPKKMNEETDLDEEFKTKAAIVFETAVNEKADMIREELEASYEAKLAEELEAVNEKVNEYVDYAVQEWIKENQLEIKYSLRTEIAENFISGLKSLFEENYVEIPEEEFSVVDELTEAVESMKDQLSESTEALEAAQQELLSIKRAGIVEAVAEDLTETQKIRLEKLSESVEASDIEEFQFKVEALKDSYFDPSAETESLLGSLSEEVIGGESAFLEEEVNATDSVSMYANFLSRTTLKQ